jgi:hypothetical protein
MISPSSGTVLGTSNVQFKWGTATGATQYSLWLGLNGPGSSDLYIAGWSAATSAIAASVPAKGAKVYARLFSDVDGAIEYNDYTYTETPPGVAAMLISPPSSIPLGTSGVQFEWTAGTGATQYNLWLGLNGPGSSDLFISGWGTTTSATVPTLPAKGATVHARLFSNVYGVIEYNDYTYVEQ